MNRSFLFFFAHFLLLFLLGKRVHNNFYYLQICWLQLANEISGLRIATPRTVNYDMALESKWRIRLARIIKFGLWFRTNVISCHTQLQETENACIVPRSVFVGCTRKAKIGQGWLGHGTISWNQFFSENLIFRTARSRGIQKPRKLISMPFQPWRIPGKLRNIPQKFLPCFCLERLPRLKSD